MLSFGHQLGTHARTLYRFPEVISTYMDATSSPSAANGGVRSAARPTPRRPTRSFDDERGSLPEALLFEVDIMDVDSMPGILLSVVPGSRGLKQDQPSGQCRQMRLTFHALDITERDISSSVQLRYDRSGPSTPDRHNNPCGNQL